MANESTVKNIRAPEAVFDRLKALTDESFPSQGAALEALLNSWEMQTAKAAIPNRETDIADFDSHVQAIQRAFVHSLELAQNADNRARDAFRQKLETLEKEKAELRQKLETAEAEKRTAQHQQENARNAAIDANAHAETAERHAATLEKALEAEKANAAAQIADKQKLIDSLTAQVSDISDRARENAAAVAKAESLKKDLAAVKRELADAQTAAQVNEAKAIAEKALAVSAAREETSVQLIQLTGENASLKVELERTKAELERTKAQLAAALETQTAASRPTPATNPAPMNDQRTAPTPKTPRKKAAAKKANDAPNANPATMGDADNAAEN